MKYITIIYTITKIYHVNIHTAYSYYTLSTPGFTLIHICHSVTSKHPVLPRKRILLHLLEHSVHSPRGKLLRTRYLDPYKIFHISAQRLTNNTNHMLKGVSLGQRFIRTIAKRCLLCRQEE